MTKYFSKCIVCKGLIQPDDLPGEPYVELINFFAGKKLLKTYCSKSCLRKDFKIKTVTKNKTFLFFKYKSRKNIWISKKEPKRHFRVVFDKI
jgi:hypothetical protein